MIKKNTIIFDISGVLFKENRLKILSNLGIVDTLKYMIVHRKNPISTCFAVFKKMSNEEKAQKNQKTLCYKGNPLPNCIYQWQSGNLSNKELLATLEKSLKHLEQEKFFSSTFERTLIERMLKQILDSETLKALTMPVWPVIEIARSLKEQGYTLLILSNQSLEIYALLQTKYPGVLDLFDGLVISAQVHMVKPEPSIYTYLLKHFDLDPLSCLFIDDQEENLIPAQKIGIDTILYTKPAALKKQLLKFDINV